MKTDTMSQAEDNWRAISNQGILQAEGKYEAKNARNLYDRGSVLAAAAAAAVQRNFLPFFDHFCLDQGTYFLLKKKKPHLYLAPDIFLGPSQFHVHSYQSHCMNVESLTLVTGS